MISIEDIRQISLALPGTSERASYGGRPSFRTKQKMFTWVREDPEALVVWVESEGDKLAMIESEPDKFFTTDHYDGHAIVLVRLESVDLQEASELIEDSFRQRATKTLIKELDARDAG